MTLFDKVYGCIMGGACGDALGGPIESMNMRFIRQLHGGTVSTMLPYTSRPDDFQQAHAPSAYAFRPEPGTYTDDTYFAIQNALCIIEKGGRISCDDLGEWWAERFDKDRSWYSTGNSLEKLRRTAIPPRDIGAGTIGENSSAMCIGPVGAINAGNPRRAALDAYDVVSFMHWEHSREAAAVIAAAVAEAFKPDATVDSVVAAAVGNIPGGKYSRMHEALELSLRLARQAKDPEELTFLYHDQLIIDWIGRGKTRATDGRHDDSCEAYESIACAIGMFLNAGGDSKKTLVATANFGRDCDSIACMAGYIVGAFGGIQSLPEDWVAAVRAANPEGPDLGAMAQQLTTVLAQKLAADAARSRMVLAMAGQE